METSTSTRRTFVGGALAGAALMVPAAPFAPALLAPRLPAGGAADPGPGKDATGREARHWGAAVGRRFRLSAGGATVHATLTHVVDAGAAGRHAPGGRRPFRLRFVPEAASRFDGDAIYALDRPIAGMGALFLTRGLDDAGRAVLTAVIG